MATFTPAHGWVGVRTFDPEWGMRLLEAAQRTLSWRVRDQPAWPFLANPARASSIAPLKTEYGWAPRILVSVLTVPGSSPATARKNVGVPVTPAAKPSV